MEEVKTAVISQPKNTHILEFLYWCLIAFLVLFCFHPISGTSMYPTYDDGQTAFCSRIFLSLSRGDVVVAKPDEGEDLIIKRIVAVPGDTLEIKTDGSVYVNGELSEYGTGSSYTFIYESSGMELSDDGTASVTLGDNEYWLMGDNREGSKDSRYWGAFKRSEIRQLVIFVF